MALRFQEKAMGIKAGERLVLRHSQQNQLDVQTCWNILCLLADSGDSKPPALRGRDSSAGNWISEVEALLRRRDSSSGNWITEVEALVSSSVHMARTRERQPCRRGSGRGTPSRPLAAEAHHHCCRCYCFRRVGTSHLQASQFLDSYNPNEGPPGPPALPAFGTVVFNLGNLNAHISILFVKNAEEDHAGASSRELPSANQLDKVEGQATDAKGKAPVQIQTQEVLTSRAGAEEVQADPQDGYGWFPIVEMASEEMEPEE